MEENPFKFSADDVKVITPIYDYENNPGKGCFEIATDFDGETAFRVRYGAFMDHKLEIDRKENNGELFMFLMNRYHDKTVSHAIYDLYDLGFPVDDWVKDYVDYLLNKKESKVSAMLSFLHALKSFGGDADDLDPNSGSLDT